MECSVCHYVVALVGGVRLRVCRLGLQVWKCVGGKSRVNIGGNCSLEKFNALKQVFLKASDSAVLQKSTASSTVVLIC